MKRMKRIVFAGIFLCAIFTARTGAQQLTRFAVIDLDKVNVAFFKDSQAYRDFETQTAKVNRDIEQMTKEINGLKSAMYEAESKGDRDLALRLNSEAYKKSEFLKEYHRVKSAELADQKSRLNQSDSFWKRINDEIRFIAESEGYTMVLNAKDPNIRWYSVSIDITDKVINNLRSKAR
jgi:outer membrane protein